MNVLIMKNFIVHIKESFEYFVYKAQNYKHIINSLTNFCEDYGLSLKTTQSLTICTEMKSTDLLFYCYQSYIYYISPISTNLDHESIVCEVIEYPIPHEPSMSIPIIDMKTITDDIHLNETNSSVTSESEEDIVKDFISINTKFLSTPKVSKAHFCKSIPLANEDIILKEDNIERDITLTSREPCNSAHFTSKECLLNFFKFKRSNLLRYQAVMSLLGKSSLKQLDMYDVLNISNDNTVYKDNEVILELLDRYKFWTENSEKLNIRKLTFTTNIYLYNHYLLFGNTHKDKCRVLIRKLKISLINRSNAITSSKDDQRIILEMP